MSYTQLKAALRSGARPEDLPGFNFLGAGGNQQAWTNGVFVVKRAWYDVGSARAMRRSAVKHTPKDIRDVRLAPSRFIPEPNGEGTLTIQIKTRVVECAEFKKLGGYGKLPNAWDIKSCNAGLDKRGRFVQFDW